MKKELCKREENGVLHTPDLFDITDIKWNRNRLRRLVVILACAVVVTVAVALGCFMLFGNDEGRSSQQGGDKDNGAVLPGGESERESITAGESEEESLPGESESESDTESESESANESESEGDAVTVIEKDLSATERGEGFIINFTDEEIDVEALLDRGFVNSESTVGDAPVVMIIHTHTSESYKESGGAFKGLLSVVSVGDAMTEELRRAGLSAIHCTVIHDSGNRNAYLEARETIETMLKIYPSIKYVIDVHRMMILENGIPIKTVSESGMAQVRLSVSTEEKDTGDWRESLSLALSLRHEMNLREGVCMPVVIAGGGYNSDLSVYHLVAEVGTEQNSVEEAMLAGRCLARAIAEVVIE